MGNIVATGSNVYKGETGTVNKLPESVTKSPYYHVVGDDMPYFDYERYFRFSWEDICQKTVPFGNLPIDQNGFLNTKENPPIKVVNAWAEIQQGLFLTKGRYYPPIAYADFALMFQWMYKLGFIEGDESKWVYFLQGRDEISKDLNTIAVVFHSFLRLGWSYSKLNKKLNRKDYDLYTDIQWGLKDHIPVIQSPEELKMQYAIIAKTFLTPYKDYKMPDHIILFIWQQNQKISQVFVKTLENKTYQEYPPYSLSFSSFIQEFHSTAWQHLALLQSVYVHFNAVNEKNILNYWQSIFMVQLSILAGYQLFDTVSLKDFQDKIHLLSGSEHEPKEPVFSVRIDFAFQNHIGCKPIKEWQPGPDTNDLKLMEKYDMDPKASSERKITKDELITLHSFLKKINVISFVTFIPIGTLVDSLKSDVTFRQQAEKISLIYNVFYYYLRQMKKVSDDFKKPIELWSWDQNGQTYADRSIHKNKNDHKVDQQVLDTTWPKPFEIKDKSEFMTYINYIAPMPDIREQALFEAKDEYNKKVTASKEGYRLWSNKMWELKEGLKDHPIGSKWEDKNGMSYHNWYMDYGVWDELDADKSVWSAILYVAKSPHHAAFGETLEESVIQKGKKAMTLLFEQLQTGSDLLSGFLGGIWVPVVAIGTVAIAGIYVLKEK